LKIFFDQFSAHMIPLIMQNESFYIDQNATQESSTGKLINQVTKFVNLLSDPRTISILRGDINND